MTALIDNGVFRITFQRPKDPTRRVTECILEEAVSDDLTGEWQTVGFGVARVHPNDRFSKEAGRVVALGRALASSSYFTAAEQRSQYDHMVCRGRRRAIWNAYHLRSDRTRNRVVTL